MSTRREKIVETAKDLFYKNGYRATGIDQILAEAGVSKPTMYKYFRSKDELIIASLKLWDTEFRTRLDKFMDDFSGSAHDRFLHLFEFLKSWFESPEFNGCMYISASVEYSDHNNSINQLAREQKESLTSYIEKLLKDSSVMDSDSVAKQISMVVEGAVTTAHLVGSSDAAAEAKSIASLIINSRANSVAA